MTTTGGASASQSATAAAVAAMRKVHLHCHLEGAVRFSTLCELLPADVRPTDGDDAAVAAAARAHFCIVEPVASLTECMARFGALQKLFTDERVVERVAFEVVEDNARDDNVVLLELRYSPGYIQLGHNTMQLQQIHDAVMRGVRRARATYKHIEVGLIAILDRFATDDDARRHMDFVLANRADFVAVDLANDEVAFADRIFTAEFDRAAAAGLGVTIHCGEVRDSGAPGRVRRAVDVQHATRIGHGLYVLDDDDVVEYVRQGGVHFEVSLTSNVRIGAVASVKEHPLPTMIAKLASVSLNTDDPGLFCTTLNAELVLAVNECGLTLEQLRAAQVAACDASFLDADARRRVRDLLAQNE